MATATWSWAKAGGALTLHADRFLGTDDPSIPWDALGPERLPEPARARERRAWTLRAHDEYRSMVAFVGLLHDLTETVAPLDVLGCAARLVRDETRHVSLCARVVESLGGADPAAGEPHWVRADSARSARDRVAMTIVGSLCVGETLSMAMIAAAREETTNEALHAVTTLILADESFHSRFGFAWAKASWRPLPMSTKLYVESSLPKIFARLEREQPPARKAVFEKTIIETILPELTEAGVHAERAWKERAT